MKYYRNNFALYALLIGLLLTVSAQAATYTVNQTTDAGDGVCDVTCTLRDAILQANATAVDDTITFDSAVFGTAQTIVLTAQLTIANNSGVLTIEGTGANLLAISGNDAVTVFRNDNQTANVVINALTVTRGRGAFGGGIANAGPSGNLMMNFCVISFNTATNSGGGFNTDGTLTLNNSTINNNTAGINGGGISNGGTVGNGGGVTLNNSTVSTNTASNGGGIDNGTFNNGSRLTLNSSTLSNNSNSLRNNGAASTTTLNNTIIANSTTGSDCLRASGTINATYSLIEQNLTCVNGTNSNNLTGDPNLGPLADNGGPTFTHALLPGSIAIDTGNSTLTTDQRGFMRPVDDPIAPNGTGNLADRGAFEIQAPTAASVSISGRVQIAGGRGLPNAIVFLTDQSGVTQMTRTSSFGYYRLEDIAAGQTVVIQIASKRFSFVPQIFTVNEDMTDLNFNVQ